MIWWRARGGDSNNGIQQGQCRSPGVPGPADPIFGMPPPPVPLGAPSPHLSPAVLALLLPVHPGPGRVMAPAGLRGQGVPCPDKLELLQGEPRMREGRTGVGSRCWGTGTLQPQPQPVARPGWLNRVGDAGPRLHPSSTTASLPSSPQGTSFLLSHPASGTAQLGDTDGKAGTEIQPPCAGTQSRDMEPGASLGQKLFTASAWCSQPRWGRFPLQM